MKLLDRLRGLYRRNWLDIDYFRRVYGRGGDTSIDIKIRVKDRRVDVWLNDEHHRGWTAQTQVLAVNQATKIMRELIDEHQHHDDKQPG